MNNNKIKTLEMEMEVPKKALSGYQIFIKQNLERIREQYKDSDQSYIRIA